MRIFFLLLGLLFTVYAEETTETTVEPFEHGDSLEITMPKETSPAPAEPHPTPEPEPVPEPSPKASMEVTDEPTPEPEPAIKFDQLQTEDYGDAQEIAETNSVPDQVNDEVINELVENFLNTGSTQGNKTVVKHANPAVYALVGSSDYWKTDNIQPAGSIKDADAAMKWVDGYQKEAQKIMQEVAVASWKYIDSTSPKTKKALDEAEEVLAQFVRASSMQGKQFDKQSITDPAVLRQLEFVTFEGMSALSGEDYTQFNNAQAQVNIAVANSAVCEKDTPPPCALKKVDLESIFYNEKDASRLAHLWVNFLTSVAGSKPSYEEFIKYSTEGAKLNGFSDAGAMWRSAFDLSSKTKKPVIDFKQKMQNVYDKLEPFYKQLHGYMRRQIAGIYENAADLSKDGPIPAHLFGSLSGGDWTTHYEQTKPYDEEDLSEEILAALHTQNYTNKQLYTKAYRYFKITGFPSLPASFWTNSIFARVWSKEMICNPPAAIDMRDGNDFRVKVCAQLGETDFQLAHSLLAQTYYQYLYKDQPFLFRESASPVISDAIAKVFSLISVNPHYLHSQKLVSAAHLDIKESVVVNRLYKEALSNVAKIPFSLVADNWRYELFEGKLKLDKANDRWWQLRNKYEGVRSPQPYNSSNMDALMHTSMSQVHSPATKDVLSYVIQFQILKAICPEGVILSDGCILSEDTTEKLRKMMSMGSSITWLKALEMITGSSEIDPAPLLEYYEPLISWLSNQNEIDQVYVGWDGEGTAFSRDEIPKPRMGQDSGSGILSQDRVAYPGQECSHGQECLLESTCNGTICVCLPGKYTLEWGGTTSCVDGKPPIDVNDEGKTLIDLIPAETTSTQTPSSTRRPTRVKAAGGLRLTPLLVLLFSALFVM